MRVLSFAGPDPCIARVSDHSAKEGNYEWITRKREREREKKKPCRHAVAAKQVCHDNRTKYNSHYAIIVLISASDDARKPFAQNKNVRG